MEEEWSGLTVFQIAKRHTCGRVDCAFPWCRVLSLEVRYAAASET